MDGHHVIAWLVIGLVAGALAGRVVDGGGFGVLGDLVVGLVGALIGGFIWGQLGYDSVSPSFLGECLVAFAGAVVLLAVLRLLGHGRRGRSRGLGGGRRRRFGW